MRLAKHSDIDRLIPLADAAELTGLSPWTLRRWCSAGRLASVKMPNTPKGRVLIPTSALDALIAAGFRPARAVTEPMA